MASTYVNHPIDWYDYQDGRLSTVETRYAGRDPSFDTLLCMLANKADPQNLARIAEAFPEKITCWRERNRNERGGLLDGDPTDAYAEVFPGRRR